ncbi:MAG TPA: hypothetical protein VK576_04755 [Thermoleophilia bacterium]|nr:hypothetical protein [Thermoleophilia bacterium]
MADGLTKKLQLKEGQRLTLLHPPTGYEARLATELPGVTLDTGALPDAVLAFVASRAEARDVAPHAFETVRDGGLVWLAYPKGGSGIATDLNRDVLWKTLDSTGWRPVRQVALDDSWSAMRFRPEAEVGT